MKTNLSYGCREVGKEEEERLSGLNISRDPDNEVTVKRQRCALLSCVTQTETELGFQKVTIL